MDFSKREEFCLTVFRVWFGALTFFFHFSLRSINCLVQTLNSLTKLKQKNKMECNDQEIPFVFFSLSPFHHSVECVQNCMRVIHLYPNRNIGFAILDQSIGPSMLYSYCLWHHMIHEAPEERELLAYPRDSKSIAQCNLWDERLHCSG